MNLILTMAGKYSRFKDAGLNIPKYLLPWGYGTILSEIIAGFHVNSIQEIYIVMNKADEPYLPHVKAIMENGGMSSKNILMIDDNSGQAETASQGINHFISEIQGEPLIIHNIDTILKERDYSQVARELKEFSGYIDVFKSNNHEYSYVLSEGGYVKAIAEKVLISQTATSGLYGFAYPEIYMHNYIGQTYISDVYKKMIKGNYQVKISPVYTEKNTIVLGTPKEYFEQAKNI